MTSERYENFQKFKAQLEMMGSAKINEKEALQLTDYAEGVFLSRTEMETIENHQKATEMIEMFTKNRPSWEHSAKAVKELKESLEGCAGKTVSTEKELATV